MASFADVERFFERIFERSSATLFRVRIQAVQIEHRVERSMERARSHQGSRIVVPGHYRVRLSPDDLADLAPGQPEAVALAARLADAALGFARAHAYQVPARPVVVLVADPSLARGQVEVDVGPVPPAAITRDPAPAVAVDPSPVSRSLLATGPAVIAAATVPPVPEEASIADLPAHVPPTVEPPAAPTAAAAAPPPPIAPVHDGVRGDGTQTMVFRRPAPPATRATLRICEPDGTERTIEVDGSPLELGRSSDNRLVLSDPRVSRRHGRLQARRGALVYTDLGSTNGSRVNGIRVDEIALGLGDRVLVGDTVLIVESLPG
jgi:hypothetical protein